MSLLLQSRKSQMFLTLCAALFQAHFGSAEELPVETFFQNYQYSQVGLSPDGNHLAALASVHKRLALAVLDLQSRVPTWAFAHRALNVGWYWWANTNRLFLAAGKDGILFELYSVNRDGTHPIDINPRHCYCTGFIGLLPGSPDELLIGSILPGDVSRYASLLYPNVERMQLNSGYTTREVTNPGNVTRWMADRNGVVRIGWAREDTRMKILYRPNNQAKWETIADYNYDEDGIDPIGFDYDNAKLLVRDYGGEQVEGIYTFDVGKKRTQTLAFRHAEADAETLVFSNWKQAIVGVTYQTDRPQVYWLDPDYKKMQASIDRALPETANSFVGGARDETKHIILAGSDRNPGTYYLFDRRASRLEKLFDVAPWVKPEEMATMKPIEYTARDGLTIHGYLTVPRDYSGKPAPMVVNPHGGPIARDSWGYNPEAQFLANRGYAVLQMNFRGSVGYGKDFLRAGFKQWGLKQQDDITDGVKWAIAQGIADPKRIAIYGSSYVGFAALTGLEKTPELYRCGISYCGVTDIMRRLRAIPDIKVFRMEAADHVGDPKKEKERLQETSPVNNVDKIKVPVFIACGELDPKVTIGSQREMAKALKKRGLLYDFMVKDNEGHGFQKEENRIEFWKKVDQFLKANLN